MSSLARALAQLLHSEPHITAHDLPIALHAHTAAIDLVDEVLTGRQELVRHGGRRAHRHRVDPVGSLAREIRAHPRSHEGPSLTDLLRESVRTTRTPKWIAVAAHAEAAMVHWQEEQIRPSLSPSQAWSTTADAASIADVLARLDRGIATCLSSTGDEEQAARYRRAAQTTSLALATVDLARGGPLAGITSIERARPHLVDSGWDLLRSQKTTARLLDQAHELQPTDVIKTASAQVQIAARLAQRLHTIDGGVAERLSDVALRLNPAMDSIHSLRSINGGSHAPVVQGRLAWERVNRLDRPPDLLAAGLAFLGGSRGVIRALHESVVTQEGRGRWLHHAERSDHLTWERRFLAHSRLSEVMADVRDWAETEPGLRPLALATTAPPRTILPSADLGSRRPTYPPVDVRPVNASRSMARAGSGPRPAPPQARNGRFLQRP